MPMRLPTKARYGMRAMLDLALHYEEDKPVLMRDIAARQGLPEKYLEQVLIPLRHARLVRSVRGAGGGYLLTRDPAQITLLEIVEASIGELTMVDCTGDPGYCERGERCATQVVWKELTQAIRDSLMNRTLAGLVDIETGLKSGKSLAPHEAGGKK
ncbi:MAG: Rrf2 family transcriptional regulator [Actinomycetota bacterium]